MSSFTTALRLEGHGAWVRDFMIAPKSSFYVTVWEMLPAKCVGWRKVQCRDRHLGQRLS